MSGQRKGSRQAVRMVGAGGYESAPLPLRRTKYTPPLALTRRLARRGHPRQRPDWLLRPRLLASAVCPRPLLGPPCAPCSQRRFRRESRRWRRTSCETPCGEDEAPGIRFYHAANLADPRMLQRHCGSTRRRRNDRGAGVPCRWAGQALLASASPCPAYVQRLVFVGREDGKLLALRQLIHDGFTPPALVFVQVGAAESENKGDLMCVWSDSCSISLSFVNLRLSLSQSKERAIELHKALALECRCEQEARAPQIGIGILRTSLNFIGLCCTCPSPLVQQLWWPVQRRHDSRRPDASAGARCRENQPRRPTFSNHSHFSLHLQREATLTAFRRGDLWILVTTDLLARGMDFQASVQEQLLLWDIRGSSLCGDIACFKFQSIRQYPWRPSLQGVRLVVNYDFPPSAVSYVHRVGRTGRAGTCELPKMSTNPADLPTLVFRRPCGVCHHTLY